MLSNREKHHTLGTFQNKSAKLFFQMSVQVHSVLGQTEGRRKTFLEQASINLSCKLSRTCGEIFNYYKSVPHSIPTLPDGIENTQAVFKTNQ